MSNQGGWENVKLKEVNPNMEIVPVGTYTFGIGKAEWNADTPGRFSVRCSIVSEGDFRNRSLFLNFNPPGAEGAKSQSAKVLKRLETALGIDMDEGEDPVAYCNRAAAAYGRFITDVKHWTPKPTADDPEPNPKDQINGFKIRPAA